MRKKKIFFVLGFIATIVGTVYWFAFYAKFRAKQVHTNANQIIVLNKKKLLRTAAWEWLQQPKDWQSWFKLDTVESWSWKDAGITIPDYPTLFSIKNQDPNIFYLVLSVDNSKDFQQSLEEFYFTLQQKDAQGNQYFWSDSLRLMIYKNQNKELLVSNQNNQQAIQLIATDLFANKRHLAQATIDSILKSDQHIGIWFKNNQFLEKPANFTINFEQDSIFLNGTLQWKQKFAPKPKDFQWQESIASLGFTFNKNWLDCLSAKQKQKINKWLALDIDSLDLEAIDFHLYDFNPQKTIVLVSDYDDDFNPIMVEETITEFWPNYQASIFSKESKHIYNYLQAKNLISDSATYKQLPFLNAKVEPQNKVLLFRSHTKVPQNNTETKQRQVGYLRLNFAKIDSQKITNYPMAKQILQLKKQFGEIQLDAKQENTQTKITAVVSPAKGKTLFEFL